MNGQRIRTIIEKEWAETLRNTTITSTFVVLLLVFTAMPLVFAFVLPAFMGEAITNDPDSEQLLTLLATTFPQIKELNALEQFQIFMLRQFTVLFLILPVMGAMSISTYSIIGEKTARSLEALLASPIRTDELLLAKSFAAAIPSVLASWVAFGLFALVTYLAGGPEVYRYTLDSAAWATILLISPLVALLGLGLGVVVSARSNDARSAQQIGGLVVLPLVAVVIGQTAGVFLLGVPLVIVAAVILFLGDLAILGLGVSLFNREAILTRWK